MLTPIISPLGDRPPQKPVYYVNRELGSSWWQVIKHENGYESVELDFLTSGNQAARLAILKNVSQ